MEAVHRQVLGARDSPSAPRVCGLVNSVLQSIAWSDAAQQLDSLCSLISDFVSITGQLDPKGVQEALEAFVARYGREISAEELTMGHVFLAEHCRHHHMRSTAIRNFARLSDLLSPDFSLVGGYFMNSAKIMSKDRTTVKEAAIAAALAVTVDPSEQFYQHWCLHELVAYGSVTPLPKYVWSSRSILVDDLAMLFGDKTLQNWFLIQKYVNEHRTALDGLGLGTLVRLAMAKFGVQVVYSMLDAVSALPTHDVLPELLATLSMEELTNAGLLDVCRIEGDTLIPVYETSISSSYLLSETGKCAQGLSVGNGSSPK